jgi:anti-sigma factor RsiW
MPLDASGCPPDPPEVAESYVMGRLGTEDARAFEAHFLICPACASAVEDADKFVRAIRTAAQRLRAEPPR